MKWSCYNFSKILFCVLLETRAETENSSRLQLFLTKEMHQWETWKKMLLLCQRLDLLNGMANCPGYHGYERVREHINHEDLGFFLSFFLFSSKRQNLSDVLYEADLWCSISACWDHGKWRGKVTVYTRREIGVCSLSQRPVVVECVLGKNTKLAELI